MSFKKAGIPIHPIILKYPQTNNNVTDHYRPYSGKTGQSFPLSPFPVRYGG
jgi:hypothetical protein